MSLSTSTKVHDAKEIAFKEKATLILEKKLIEQIRDAHLLVKTGTEWSSILLYKVESGEVTDPENLVLRAQEMVLMDVGDATYTEYDMNDPTDEYAYDKLTEALIDGTKVGHLHTH